MRTFANFPLSSFKQSAEGAAAKRLALLGAEVTHGIMASSLCRALQWQVAMALSGSSFVAKTEVLSSMSEQHRWVEDQELQGFFDVTGLFVFEGIYHKP